MSRSYYYWGQWNDVNKKIKIKPKENLRKITGVDKTSRIEKFCKCKSCGGQMTYIPNTNILVCENEIELTRTSEKDGIIRTEKYKAKCGRINLIDNKYMGYVNYLFD